MPRFAAVVLLTILALSLLTQHAAAAEPLTIYVAKTGNDACTGMLAEPNADKSDGPLASLTRARNLLRERKAAEGLGGGARVIVRGGIYSQDETFKLGPEDSAADGSTIVYAGQQGEKPVIMGAKPIIGWVAHQGKVFKTNVAEQGFKDIYFRQLFYGGARQHLARYPNFDPQNPYGGGWTFVDGKPVPMYQDVPGESRRQFIYRPQDDRPWARPDELEVFIFPRYNWWNNIVRVKQIDRENRQITLVADCSYPPRPLDRYYVRNALEELDAPGEWYLDKREGTLYFWPPDDRGGTAVYAPHLRTIVELDGVENVSFEGLNFENCEGTAVVLKDCRRCAVVRSTIRNVGDYNGSGVSINGGANNRVVGNDIYATGSHGVSLSGGDRTTLTPANNEAVNNYIHHVGVFYKQGVGVQISGCGNRAAHNLIHDGPRMGIMFSGNNHVLEYNHIRHVNLETEDTGAVYTGGRDWLGSRGTVIRYNFFHDILGYGRKGDQWVSPYYAWGVYLDDNTGGVDVIGNIVVRAFRAGLHLHNGRDNLIENNIFVDAKQQQIEYSGWTEESSGWKNHLPTMIKGYESVAGQPAWKGMRNMETHPTEAVLPDGKIMSGNVLRRNIIAYREPDARTFQFRNVDFTRNTSDHNLIWHGGLPLRTGQLRMEKTVGPNLLVNASFDEGEPDKMPPHWRLQHKPAGTAATRETLGSDQHAMRLEGGTRKDAAGKTTNAAVVSDRAAMQPGTALRLTARLKANKPDVQVSLMAQSYISNVYFWSKPQRAVVGTEWKEVELLCKLPAAGEPGHHEQMKDVAARIDLEADDATLWIDDVTLQEAVMLDEWRSWQATGNDRNSLVADPRFVDAEKDDYRLRADSPAWKLGFKPIPVEKIGPQADMPRASWPIVEAEGAREKPLSAP
jgi:parallel beta-helix repeat protein